MLVRTAGCPLGASPGKKPRASWMAPESPLMSVQTAQAGAVRRRLFPWTRSTTSKGTAAAPKAPAAGDKATATTRRREPRRPFDYGPEARPDRQGALATILPTRPSRLAMALVGIVVVTASTLVLGGWPAALGAIERFAGARFSRTVALLGELVDLRGMVLGGFVSQMFLLAAGSVALSIRGMRRHRRDGRHGRSRAWLAMAVVLVVASMAGPLKLGPLVSTFLVEATGRPLGPDGLGWWVAIAAVVTGLVSLWALLPLHQRLAPGFWLLLGLSGWSASAATAWLGGGHDAMALVGAGAWVAGSAAMFAAMLTAARGVIREVRGEIKAPPVGETTESPAGKPAKAEAIKPQSKAQEPVFESVDGDEDAAPATVSEEGSETGYTDGSEAEDDYASRPLSKAERKRLRRLGRHAA